MNENKLSSVAKYIMLALMAADIVIMILMPFKLSDWMLKYFSMDISGGIKTYYYVVIYLGGLCGLYLLNNMRKLFALMQRNSPFVRETETLLNKNAIAALITTLVTASKLFVDISLMTVIAVLVFITAALFCRVLARLFGKAVDYKEENDLTV